MNAMTDCALDAPPKQQRCTKVLLVEDHRDGREMLQTLLSLLGYDVEAAADGLEGLRKALAWRPTVAVLDIGLPGLDGYELARRLRVAFHDHIFLIALTGYNQPRDRDLA